MDFNFKIYKFIRLKNNLRQNSLFFLFDSVILNKKKWILNEQNLKKLQLKHYKPLNRITTKAFKNSIYKNFNIIGFIVFIHFCHKKTDLTLSSILKFLKPSFILISVRLNNKIYATAQVKRLDSLSYNKNVFNLYKVLNKQLKINYILTDNKKTSK